MSTVLAAAEGGGITPGEHWTVEIGGLALFQFLAIVSSMLPLIKEIRQK